MAQPLFRAADARAQRERRRRRREPVRPALLPRRQLRRARGARRARRARAPSRSRGRASACASACARRSSRGRSGTSSSTRPTRPCCARSGTTPRSACTAGSATSCCSCGRGASTSSWPRTASTKRFLKVGRTERRRPLARPRNVLRSDGRELARARAPSRPQQLAPAPPGRHPARAVFDAATHLAVAFLVSLLVFWKALRGVFVRPDMIPPRVAHISPLLLYVYFALRAVFPWSERGPMWSAVLDVVTAPFAQVDFKEAYVGDILTSTVRVLVDLAFASAYCAWGLAGWFASSQRDGALHAWKRHDAFEAHALHLDADRSATPLFARVVVPSLTVSPLCALLSASTARTTSARAGRTSATRASTRARSRSRSGACTTRAARRGLDRRVRVRDALPVRVGPLHGLGRRAAAEARGGLPGLRARLLYGRRGYYLAAIVGNLVPPRGRRRHPRARARGRRRGRRRRARLPRRLPAQARRSSPRARSCAARSGALRLENEHLHVYGTGHARLDDADAGARAATRPSPRTSASSSAAAPAPRAAERLLKSRSGGGGGGGAPADEGALAGARRARYRWRARRRRRREVPARRASSACATRRTT